MALTCLARAVLVLNVLPHWSHCTDAIAPLKDTPPVLLQTIITAFDSKNTVVVEASRRAQNV